MDTSSDTGDDPTCTECGRRQQGRGYRYFRAGGLAVCDDCWPLRPTGVIGDPRWHAAHAPLVTHHV